MKYQKIPRNAHLFVITGFPIFIGNYWFPALRGTFRQFRQVIKKSSDQKIKVDKNRGFIYLRSFRGGSRRIAARHFSGRFANNYQKLLENIKIHKNAIYVFPSWYLLVFTGISW